MQMRRDPAPALRGHVSSYYGYREETAAPMRRREGPGVDVVAILTLDYDWLIDGERQTSFVGGLRDGQVTTEHAGRSLGIQVNLVPTSAYGLFRLPLHELAQRVVPLEDVLDEPALTERLAEARDWDARFALLDAVLAERLTDARPPSAGVAWAWRRLAETNGRVAVGALAGELGWSRKRIVARFREEVGLPPKAVARLFRFEHARELAERRSLSWAEIALECGYYDQSHLINEFRAITERTPETFLQDTVPAAA